jgi:hypothetical protein
MRTYAVEFKSLSFGLFMYCRNGDGPPTPADVRMALKRRGLPDRAIAGMACSVEPVTRVDFGAGKLSRLHAAPRS